MIRALLAFVVALTLAGPSLAQTAAVSYPSKPIRFIVPYAPGGSTSYVARLVGAKLTEAWGQQVLIDNKPGANTVIGTEALARSGPDGYTISLAASTHVTVPHLVSSLPFDVLRDFTPVASLVTTQLVLVVHPSVPASNVSEFIALAKARPNELNFAAVGTGSSTHLAGEYFKSVAGVKMQHVPYKGTAPALTDLIGGQIQLNFDTPVTSIPHVKAGRLRALAITGTKRLATLPDVPTFAEAGLPAYDFQLWFGVLAPAGTPRPIIEKLSAEIARILAMPDVKQQLAEQGLDTAYRPSAEFDALLRTDHERFGKLISSAGIKIE
ncbi:Bug family tripartite tricarboxylate transporter substrate binding protein [Piscinibacter koreensis]|uniref:Tripartite tricarboxylate transporter substrate binding protein n=1 Tax=Piscinibacter koreensis TaxID=2742824 RepID=A0A7Y6NQK5_9BURK|nr:tripartite tricarboxylate transporter substrate binding protein [Schlegelella koreensis]NUZ07523.1 tripartite tricarboxylate transporter substrate binding protein [Schlegelella koreensis]